MKKKLNWKKGVEFNAGTIKIEDAFVPEGSLIGTGIDVLIIKDGKEVSRRNFMNTDMAEGYASRLKMGIEK